MGLLVLASLKSFYSEGLVMMENLRWDGMFTEKPKSETTTKRKWWNNWISFEDPTVLPDSAMTNEPLWDISTVRTMNLEGF